jgi:hypothetical protein
MFQLELVRQWSLDVRKMIRPERSGVIGCLFVYAILWGYGYAIIPHLWGGGFSPLCYFAPWECPAPKETAIEIEKHYNIHLLYSGMGNLMDDKKHVCHLDIQYEGRQVDHHYDFEIPSEQAYWQVWFNPYGHDDFRLSWWGTNNKFIVLTAPGRAWAHCDKEPEREAGAGEGS